MKQSSAFLLAICLAVPPFIVGSSAAEESDSALQIDLEALESLNPGREAGTEPQVPILAPADGRETGTPEIAPANPLGRDTAPHNPAAPRPGVVSTAPAGNRTAASLRDLIIPILFQPDSDQVNLKETSALDDVIDLVRNKGVRVQLMAYAGKVEASQSEMRRLSLKRAIAVRGYLMSRGIDGTRIDVRPNGIAPDNPKERVDIIFLPQ
jgi:outer membrane protein OmpA-like peptidoglycan-associated protein